MTHRLHRIMTSCMVLTCSYLFINTANANPHNQKDATMLDVLSRESANLTTFTLPNGLQVILKPDKSAPVASVQFWLGSGSIHEEAYTGAGISHAIEHMIFKGTPNLPPGDLSRIIQEAGGRLNAYTTLDRTVYFADLPSSHWQTAFDLYAEAIFHASFPAEEWNSEREVIMREIAMGEDSPDRVLIQRLWQTAVRVAPYRHPVIGYTDTFASLTRDDLAAHHKRHYTPCNTTLIIIGDIDLTAVRAHVTDSLSKLPRPTRAPVIIPTEPQQAAPRIERFSEPHNLTRVAQVWPAPVFPHPDAAALQVLAHIAGSGRSARLHRKLVEENGLLLNINAWYYDRGFLGITAQLEPHQESQALTTLEQEVNQLKSSTFSEAEVNRAIQSMLTSTLKSFTTMSGQAAHYGWLNHVAASPYADRVLLEQIAAVTPDDVARVARTWIQPNTLSRVILAPPNAAATNAPESDRQSSATEIRKEVLPNGVTLLLKPDARLPFVYISAALKGGLLSEPPGRAGITALMAELLTRGTKNRTRDEIAETVESRGASLSSFSGFNAYGLSAQGLATDTSFLLDLLADILLNPTFPQDELERQRTRQIAALQRMQEQPVTQAMLQMRAMLFPDHPYQYMPQGTEDNLLKIQREDIVAHHASLTTGSNLVIAVFGDMNPEEVRNQLAAAIATLPPGSDPIPVYAHPKTIAEPQNAKITAPRQQAIVVTAFPALDIFDPDADTIALLQTALSGMSSALFQEVREKRGLAYFTSATQQAGLHPGFFALFAGTQLETYDQVEALMQVEIERIRESGLTEAEFQRARAQMLASHDMQLQEQMDMATNAALHERYGLGANHPYQFPERIKSVTPEQVHQLATRIFEPQRQVTAILVPEAAASNAGTINE